MAASTATTVFCAADAGAVLLASVAMSLDCLTVRRAELR
jgi:hypothetical protein